jgi:hypothetical protein
MLVTALALAAAAAPPTAANRVATGLRVEAIVVRPPAMPSVRRAPQGLVIDNPGAIAIAVDDGRPSARRTLRLTRGGSIRRITFIF